MKPCPSHIFLIVILSLCPLFNAGCDRSSSSGSSSSSWTPTKSNVSGFYVSDSGMIGGGGTIKLSYGSFIFKDPMLSNGTMFGDYTVEGDTITFYSGGTQVFQARVYQDRLVAGNRGIIYHKK